MRVYTVHARPGLAEDPVLVKEGFCWPAFLFTLLWVLYHRLWLLALALLAVEVGLTLLLEALGASEPTGLAASLAISVLVGLFGNDARRAALARRGFDFDGVVAADGADAALRRWCDLRPGAYG